MEPPSVYALEVRGVTKTFKNTTALDGVSLEIEAGELVVILGPSGCGKSTLLAIVAGLEEADSGEIYMGGRPILDLSPRDRDVAMVFQSYALYPHMTVRENLGFGLRMRKQEKGTIAANVEEVAEVLNIAHLLERKPRQLSGGERQRVAMGRALARRPQVFLLDEPLSNLDALLRAQIRTEIKKLHAELGTTMVFVTHDQVEAMTLADRIAIMDKGRIVQVGTPHEIYERPLTSFVASFLGSPGMNVIDASSRETGDRLCLGSGRVALRTGAWRPPANCLVGFRPESIALCTEGAPRGDADLCFRGTVEMLEPTGADLFAVIHGDGFRARGRFGNGVLEAGTQANFAVAKDDLHFFERESGQRLEVVRTLQD
jgi:ABC-type sugar transport system ATPase subunit